MVLFIEKLLELHIAELNMNRLKMLVLAIPISQERILNPQNLSLIRVTKLEATGQTAIKNMGKPMFSGS